MDRQDFLHKKWSRYPVLDQTKNKILSRGRLVDFDRQNSHVILQDETGVRKISISSADWSCLVRGDLVSISAQGELCLHAPCLQPSWRNFLEKKEKIKKWNLFLHEVKIFFEKKDFLHIETPTLVDCPGTEPTLDVFKTELMRGRHKRLKYLPTSPELHLKKALVGGLEKIFEIKNCFRNGEFTPHHLPEFKMLEWYRAWQGLKEIQNDVIELVKQFEPEVVVVELTMRELFKTYCDAEITPQWSQKEYLALAEKMQLTVSPRMDLNDLFFLIFTERIESRFHREQLIFVKDWPPFQAALARVSETGWAERFEVYWRGLELANAFHELNDEKLQRERSQSDLREKLKNEKEILQLDEDFFKALAEGMPPSAGIALGVDRLFMALYQMTDIRDFRLFTYSEDSGSSN